MEQIARRSGSRSPDPAIYLTAREYDVIRLVGQGRGNQEIAKSLFISDKTVKTSVSDISSQTKFDRPHTIGNLRD